MEKVWIKRFPKGVPAEINPKAYSSLLDVFEKSFEKFKDSPCFTNMGKTLTFGQVDELSRDFAAYLQVGLGLKKGDRFGIQMPNCLQYPVALIGALRAGLVVVNTNPLYTPREMAHQFQDSGVRAVLVLSNFASNLQGILPLGNIQHVLVTDIGDLLGFPKSLIVNAVVKYVKKMVPKYELPNAVTFNEALSQGSRLKLEKPSVKLEDTAFLQYTGGTTGVSKGAVLTHGNLVANMEQATTWMSPLLRAGEEIVITALPLYHIFSLTANLLIFFKFGGQNVLITNPKDMAGFIKEIKNIPFTVMTGVNTLFNGLMNHPHFAQCNFSKIKVSVGGGMALQSAVTIRWKKLTNSVLLEAYGLTETSPLLTCNPLDGNDRVGYIGLPVSSTDIKLVDDNNREVPQGEPGELCARGPQVMKEYWNRPDETKNVLKDGWFHTGDIAVMDKDGYFKIVDRKKEMILVSGFNVYPNEVEEVVSSHPGVLEVGAIGVPDEKSGEVVKVVVVKRDPNLTSEDLKAFCKDRLAGYKMPRHVEFRTELPKSPVGKVLRRLLKEKTA